MWYNIPRYSRSGFDKEEKLITRGRVHHLELMEFQLLPRYGLQKEASLSAVATKCFETSYIGKAMIGD